MKKVSLILLLVIVLSTVLMAQVPTKMVRLTVINKSGDDVFIKLNGSNISDPPFFYYLTIPTGDSDSPSIKVFTIMSDVYNRETWACNEFRTAGTLIVTGNLRLTFTPCGRAAVLPLQYLFLTAGGNYIVTRDLTTVPATALLVSTATRRNAGEPTQEKVVAFRQVLYGEPNWANVTDYAGYWITGCANFYYRTRTWRTPVGCAWRYQY